MVAGEGQRDGIVREFGMDMDTLLYLKQITSKDLLYGIRNSAQCYVAAWMGKEFGENGYAMCICLAKSLCHPSETIMALLIIYIPKQN